MSLVIDTKSHNREDYVQVTNLPKYVYHTDWIKVEYACSKQRIVGVEIVADVEKFTKRKIFRKAWKCNPSARNKSKYVKLKLPDNLAYRPDLYSSEYKFVYNSKLKAWILAPDWWKVAKRNHDAYSRSLVKVSYDVNFPAPFSRMPRPRRWPYNVISDISVMNIPSCPYENEVVKLISYPAVINGLAYGVYRSFSPFNNLDLERHRRKMIRHPRLTISVWVYILDYCHGGGLCSIMHHMTWDRQYRTPLIFITREGKFHIQVTLANGETSAAIPYFTAPKHQWFRLVLRIEDRQWKLTLNLGEDFTKTLHTEYTNAGDVYLDDTEGLFVMGGAEQTNGFRGYIGQATYYRNKLVDPKQIPFPSPYHPMFELGLTKRDEKCHHFTKWVNQRSAWYYRHKRNKQFQDRCYKPFMEYTRKWKFIIKDLPDSNKCSIMDASLSKNYKIVDGIIRRKIKRRRHANVKEIADSLYNKTIVSVERNIKQLRRHIRTLKQSSCLGQYDAMYMLSVVLSNGFFVKSDPIQSQAYHMLGTLGRHRLSALALAHKHRYGLDGVTIDPEQAYMYFKYVADTTRADRETHKETDVETESVRLTDEDTLREQTDEDGDVFHWLKHQAQKGVLTAQQQVARALFWGSQGLKRNMQAAIEYFKMGAESQDPVAMYDYGILLVRGQGTKKNVSEGLDHIKKSANKKNPAALNALGWYALNYDRNITLAVEYFEEAYRLGNPDAANSLGSLHLNGHYPDREADADLALQYFSFAAVRHQFDAGVALAYMNIKGTSRQPRSVHVAVEWARYIAEKNPAIGLVLRKALHAYRNREYSSATLYYMLTAEAGKEVGTFNLAWLCENNVDGIVTNIEKECQWRNYNISTHREPQFVDPYALIKMGDYYWYGCEGKKDIEKASEFYLEAAKKRDPHAVFNLGFMLEEGAEINDNVWKQLGVPRQLRKNKNEILKFLYNKCRESRKTEAYIPCSLAYYRIQALMFYEKYRFIIEPCSFVLAALVTTVSIYYIIRHVTGAGAQIVHDDDMEGDQI
ncbi:hypothetical protein FSP39_000229 [Pinctada imbricata]|uniref:Uncharacterized protein n=1 Tax=Pinctada imbricata TaxID=66713 RepID=A0AA88YJD5_PINIB|nr:hypothetical protein FSP39_000229 [Pinctada imbricata]